MTICHLYVYSSVKCYLDSCSSVGVTKSHYVMSICGFVFSNC